MQTIKYFRFSPLLKLLLAFLVIAGFTACEEDKTQNLEARNWSLTWSDEFDGAAGQGIDATKWTYDIGTGDNGWGNQELQYYTDEAENVSLDGDGNLVITARREAFGGSPFTSARIKTQDLFEQTYGRFEARMKTPYGPGMWPAFWLLGANIDEVNWPQCGEIDVMELRGQQPDKIAGSVHGPGYSGGNAITSDFTLENSRFDQEYHLFAIEWGEDYINYFVDDFLFNRITPEDVTGEWVFDQPFFMILNLAVGGNYVGFPTSQTPFPQTIVVDYIRVYQEQN
ncbi:glycoside hydrolase family 16 protein [Neolewinella persica]|uniref:glycoside hydrolase family 16 protein n=1 Tax=Neolewinella persica TaxID=70998 RepID=UPI000374668A|nr:glycoside hydrolase family 16 protein [Neolewinella persica]